MGFPIFTYETHGGRGSGGEEQKEWLLNELKYVGMEVCVCGWRRGVGLFRKGQWIVSCQNTIRLCLSTTDKCFFVWSSPTLINYNRNKNTDTTNLSQSTTHLLWWVLCTTNNKIKVYMFIVKSTFLTGGFVARTYFVLLVLYNNNKKSFDERRNVELDNLRTQQSTQLTFASRVSNLHLSSTSIQPRPTPILNTRVFEGLKGWVINGLVALITHQAPCSWKNSK